jgi:hypothetical protein
VTGWIADVAPQTTIRSQWGNTIRSQVVQTYASVADRNTATVPQEGMLAWTAAESTLWLYTATAWRVLREPWQSRPLSSMTITTGAGASPTSGTIQYRRYDVNDAEWRCNVLAAGASPGGGGGLTIFPGVTFDTTAMGALGLAVINDANSGRSIGVGAVNGGPGVQSGFYVLGSEGLLVQVSDPASHTNPWQFWSGFAGSRFMIHLPHVAYV